MSKHLLQEIYLDRAKDLMAKLKSASLLSHGPTVGTLKELAIIDSITNVIPHDYDVNNGFVTDAYGETSPQIDVLIYKKAELAPVLLSKNSVVLPFELFRIGIEVKSTVQSKHFKQLASHCESFSKMCSTAFIRIPTSTGYPLIPFKKMPPPLYLIAADSTLSVKRLKDELNKLNGIRGILIINKCLLFNGTDGYPHTSFSPIERIVRFWAVLNKDCQDLSPYLSITEDLFIAILESIKEKHEEIDINNPMIIGRIFNDLISPSLYPYLYPLGPRRDNGS